jgi:phosphoribosyl-dephospho-CoA transferase
MPPLRRHQLAHLTASGWRRVLQRPWDPEARACLRHWAGQALPLVVTQQRLPQPTPDDPVGPGLGLALGLAAPARWAHRRLALQVAPTDIAWLGEFPTLGQVLGLLPRGDRAALQALAQSLQRHGVRAHAYGSAGWQQLTGLDHLHERSDLDLWLAVDGAPQADAAVQALGACDSRVRLDGELMFADGSAVAWREWGAWREGRCTQVLVKRLHGAALEADPQALAAVWPCIA